MVAADSHESSALSLSFQVSHTVWCLLHDKLTSLQAGGVMQGCCQWKFHVPNMCFYIHFTFTVVQTITHEERCVLFVHIFFWAPHDCWETARISISPFLEPFICPQANCILSELKWQRHLHPAFPGSWCTTGLWQIATDTPPLSASPETHV